MPQRTRLVKRPRVADLASEGPRNALDVHARRDAAEGRARRPTNATGGDAAELRAGTARGVAQRASDAAAEWGAVRVAHNGPPSTRAIASHAASHSSREA